MENSSQLFSELDRVESIKKLTSIFACDIVPDANGRVVRSHTYANDSLSHMRGKTVNYITVHLVQGNEVASIGGRTLTVSDGTANSTKAFNVFEHLHKADYEALLNDIANSATRPEGSNAVTDYVSQSKIEATLGLRGYFVERAIDRNKFTVNGDTVPVIRLFMHFNDLVKTGIEVRVDQQIQRLKAQQKITEIEDKSLPPNPDDLDG